MFGIKRVAERGLDPLAAAAIVAGLASGLVFVRSQVGAADPLLDLRLFRAPAFGAAVAAMVLATFVLAGMLLFVAQYLQLVRGMGPLEAGLWSIPAMLGSIAGSMLAPAAASARRSTASGSARRSRMRSAAPARRPRRTPWAGQSAPRTPCPPACWRRRATRS